MIIEIKDIFLYDIFRIKLFIVFILNDNIKDD